MASERTEVPYPNFTLLSVATTSAHTASGFLLASMTAWRAGSRAARSREPSRAWSSKSHAASTPASDTRTPCGSLHVASMFGSHTVPYAPRKCRSQSWLACQLDIRQA